MSIADKVSVIRQGRHVQTDNPEKIYPFPATAYVSDFFGKTNYIKAKVSPEGFKTSMGLIRTKTPLPADLKEVLLSIRPEEFTICNEKDNCFCGTIVSERFMGEYKELTCIVENLSGGDTEIIIYASPDTRYKDEKCCFKPSENKINILK